jgi:hypothetical protein
VITFPDKNSLYRRTEKRLVPSWLRVAAVVLLMVGGGTAVWLNSDAPQHTNPDVAVTIPKQNKPATQPAATPDKTPATANSNSPVVETSTPTRKEGVYAANTPALKKPSGKELKKETISNPHTDVTDVTDAVASNPLPDAKKADVRLETTTTQEIVQQVNKPAVTPDAHSSYVPLNDATAKTMVPVHAVTETTTDERGGGSVKGFLRKATRFIERRTGIKTVNDDNELLVGAVALKL